MRRIAGLSALLLLAMNVGSAPAHSPCDTYDGKFEFKTYKWKVWGGTWEGAPAPGITFRWVSHDGRHAVFEVAGGYALNAICAKAGPYAGSGYSVTPNLPVRGPCSVKIHSHHKALSHVTFDTEVDCVPEIDPQSSGGALALVIGATLLVVDLRRRRRTAGGVL